jgi:decaprenylphospho-beta-D-ribofuranose 2-oxidase
VTFADHAPRSLVPDGDPLAFAPRALATVPRVIPNGLLNPRTVAAFNEAWFRAAPRCRAGEMQSMTRFFHPLDALGHWYRLYGAGGMVQYQFVVPLGAQETVRQAVRRLAETGAASFLTVLKRFGPASPGFLSFPRAGWTLTLDIPARTPGLAALLDDVDRQVVDAGGRLYLAKDSRMDPGLLRAMYPRLDHWRDVCARVDPRGVFQSDLSRRLGLRGSSLNTPKQEPSR